MPSKKGKNKSKNTSGNATANRNPTVIELDKLIATLSTLPAPGPEDHLPTFIQHLVNAVPSHSAPINLADNGDEILLAHVALRGILEIMMWPCNPQYFLELEKSWKMHIWPWMTYLHENAIRILSLASNLDKKGVKDFWGRVYATNLNILFSVAHTVGPLRDLVLGYDAQVLLGQSWAAEIMHNGVPRTSSPGVRLFAPVSEIIDMYDATKSRGLSVGLGGGEYTKAAQVVLKSVGANLRNPRDPGLVYRTFMKELMVFVQMSMANPDFQLALLEQDAIEAVCKAFATLSGMPLHDKSLAPLITRCIGSCVFFLNIHLTATDGVPWCRQAIEHEIIQSILMCCRWPLEEVDLNNIGMILTYRLTPYLLYLSVLVPADNALAEIDDSESYRLFQGILHRSGGRLWKSWNAFRTVVHDRMLLKDDAEITGFIRSCERVDCTTKGKTRTFKRCTGCSIAYYCSKECQSKDWMAHRASCRERQARQKKGLPATELSKKETKFLHYVVSSDLAQIDQPIKINGWKPDTKALTFKIKYITTSPEITIAESRSFTWATPDDPKGRTADEVTAELNAGGADEEDPPPGAAWARLVKRVETSNGGLQLLVISLPRGDEERNILTTVHIPGRVEDGMWHPLGDDEPDPFMGDDYEVSEGALEIDVQYHAWGKLEGSSTLVKLHVVVPFPYPSGLAQSDEKKQLEHARLADDLIAIARARKAIVDENFQRAATQDGGHNHHLD
ncbi:hypothetical protein LshimejAT787_0109650 [Lyophyllum shimeji]|uniref:MYND-type domain-containing protein n=1 Tax=Lyophyllum shimeji TaxID=47721 RepID=A0A9P3PEM9_LYOSH|nr:hypothetical protein LshimejAT787_0109650 [Lyophyllum shimeji]